MFCPKFSQRKMGRHIRQLFVAMGLVLSVSGCSDPSAEGRGEEPNELGAAKSAATLAGPLLGASPPPSPSPSPQAPATPAGQETVWVMMRQKANLGPARANKNWSTKGALAHGALRATAQSSQAAIQSFLSARQIPFKSFFIVNAVKLTAPRATIDELARRSDVARIIADGAYQVPPVRKTQGPAGISATEWGLENIRAPEAWSTFGAQGDGIVIANIDTGVDFNHTALVDQYRGNQGGSFDHNYNWFDPSAVCGDPSDGPCDNAEHGTHTMGTMVGDDKAGNQIGVAPHARWIAAKGCEDFSCSFEALVRSGEWMLAPTDLNGANPRTDLRPNIINNSWGGGSGDEFFREIVSAWVAAGIFPAFAAGNPGSFCGGVSSPGDYPESYAMGAYDISNQIAEFSGRGSSVFGVTKPNISAPGVDVRSSVPGNGYSFFSGTSMATPHLSGAVALLWSAAPALLGDIASTRELLDQTAIDTADLSCGGEDDNNNVYGEGRLDVFTAVDQAPRGPTGTLEGIVTDDGGVALSGARIQAQGPTTRNVFSNDSGAYRSVLPVGSYDVTASLFGYLSETVPGVEVFEAVSTQQDFALALAPAHGVSGTVHDSAGQPLAGARVTLLGTPLEPAISDDAGFFSFPSVPEGSYELSVNASGCYDSVEAELVVDDEEVLDFALAQLSDAYGYSCSRTSFNYIEATEEQNVFFDETVNLPLPFSFVFYGQFYDSVSIGENGHLQFIDPFGFSFPTNTAIPSTDFPNATIHGFWDDLDLAAGGSVRTETLGAAPNRQFVVEWVDAPLASDPGLRVSFEIVLVENGQILMQYHTAGPDPLQQGSSASAGLENEDGSVGLQYSFNSTSFSSGSAVLYTLPPSGFVRGVITDTNSGAPVAGATVEARDQGSLVRVAHSDASGNYQMQLPVGSYVLAATKTNYSVESANVAVLENETLQQDFSLKSARATVTPATLQLTVPANQVRNRTLLLESGGTLPLEYSIHETGGARQTATATAHLARNPSADPNAQNTRDLFAAGVQANGWAAALPGDVLESFAPGLGFAWGAGYSGTVWLSDVANLENYEFAVDGGASGRSWSTPWAGDWPADMAYDYTRSLMCQLAVGGDNGIYCWDTTTGTVADSISGAFPWTGVSQRGLAYRPDDDSFYVGGWNEGVIYHVRGLSHANPGEVMDSCMPPDGNISGLGWNDSVQALWAATNSPTDTIYQLNPADCTVLATLAHPVSGGFSGAGLDVDEAGNLWLVAQASQEAYLIESGVPAFSDVPWLSVTPTSGVLEPGQAQTLSVQINTAQLTPGTYLASIFVRSNAAQESLLRVPVSLIVPAYQQAVDAGSTAAYVDTLGDTWARDQRHAVGAWGYIQSGGGTDKTNHAISDTDDPKLHQTRRIDPYAYRFDNVPNGVYQVDVRLAELSNVREGKRVFDVVIENSLVLPAHDIQYEVGRYAADDWSFFVEVTDGRMDVRFVPRAGFQKPVINALRVTHRPDR